MCNSFLSISNCTFFQHSFYFRKYHKLDAYCNIITTNCKNPDFKNFRFFCSKNKNITIVSLALKYLNQYTIFYFTYRILLELGLYPPSSLVGVESRDVPRLGGDLGYREYKYILVIWTSLSRRGPRIQGVQINTSYVLLLV